MDAFWISLAAITVGEIGDKTQLLAFILAARFRRPLPVILGILVAVIANHALAGLIGSLLGKQISPVVLQWILGISFIGVAVWALIPDKMEDDQPIPLSRYGVFAATVTTFFLAEMGDKTQLATAMLAARFPNLLAVIAGTTAGMLIADIPAVFIAHKYSRKIPLTAIRYVAAAIFGAIGVATLYPLIRSALG